MEHPRSLPDGLRPREADTGGASLGVRKERLLAEPGEWKARAERERERAKRLRGEVEELRRDLEVERMRRGRRDRTASEE